MCVVKVSASDLNSGMLFVGVSVHLAGVDLLFLFVCYFAYFLRYGILPTGSA